MSNEKYFLKTAWQKKWKQVTKKQFIEAERNVAFHHTHISMVDPEFNNRCATSGFGDDSVEVEVCYVD